MPIAIRFFTSLLLLTAALGLITPPAAQAATTYYVSPAGNDGNAGTQAKPKQHVQAALTAAAGGDMVILADGAYSGDGNRDLDFEGKNLTVASLNGPASTIIDCGGTSAAAHRGFYFHRGETAVVSGLTIQHSQAAYGGGVDVENGCALTLTNCALTGNHAGDGGGIYNHGTLTLTNCTFTGNTASSGGGLDNDAGTATLTGCVLTTNTAPVGAGVENSGAATLTNCVLSGNSAVNGYGGGVFNDVGTVTQTGCTLTANSAAYGGGVYNDSALTLSGCALTGNTASFYEWLDGPGGSHYLGNGGGGVFNMGGAARLTSCTLTENSALFGGGLLNDSGTLTVSGSTLSGNSAAPAAFGSGMGLGGYGGGLFNGDISGNGSEGVVTLADDILFADSAVSGGGEAIHSSADAGAVSFNHCDVGGGLPAGDGYADAGGNLAADPLFVSAANGDLHLQAGSPCLGAGTPVNGLSTDKDGAPRLNPPALGAYERRLGLAHVLWRNANTGQTALWAVSADGNILGHAYAAAAGWTPRSWRMVPTAWPMSSGTMPAAVLPCGASPPTAPRAAAYMAPSPAGPPPACRSARTITPMSCGTRRMVRRACGTSAAMELLRARSTAPTPAGPPPA